MTILNSENKDGSITRIRFPSSCINWINCVKENSQIPHILHLYKKVISYFDDSEQCYGASDNKIIIGLTGTYVLFFGIFTKTRCTTSCEYDYDCVSNTIYHRQVDELDIISKNKFILGLTLEKYDNEYNVDYFPYSWVVVFNSMMIFIRFNKSFLNLVQDNENWEIYERLDSGRPWYHINTIQIPVPDYNCFSEFSFQRFNSSFAVEYQNCIPYGMHQCKHQNKANKLTLTINFKMNQDERSVDKESITCNCSFKGKYENSEEEINFDESDEEPDDESDEEPDEESDDEPDDESDDDRFKIE